MLNAVEPLIGIRYSCRICGVKDVEVAVRFRAPGEELALWMRDVVDPALMTDHYERSPYCPTETFESVSIPKPIGSDGVGMPVVQ